jgi:hypothetical protein
MASNLIKLNNPIKFIILPYKVNKIILGVLNNPTLQYILAINKL